MQADLAQRQPVQIVSRAKPNPTLPLELNVTSAVVDGEIVCLDGDAKPQLRDLLFRRGEPRLIAFDLLWCEGEDVRYLPLIDRKLQLRSILPKGSERLIYCDHVEQDGEGLFRLACEHDLEGIVAKRKSDPYVVDHANWLKIRNQGYSQWAGREEWFERERGSDPDFQVWDGCDDWTAQARQWQGLH